MIFLSFDLNVLNIPFMYLLNTNCNHIIIVFSKDHSSHKY
jgi:hypothetical protein